MLPAGSCLPHNGQPCKYLVPLLSLIGQTPSNLACPTCAWLSMRMAAAPVEVVTVHQASSSSTARCKGPHWHVRDVNMPVPPLRITAQAPHARKKGGFT